MSQPQKGEPRALVYTEKKSVNRNDLSKLLINVQNIMAANILSVTFVKDKLMNHLAVIHQVAEATKKVA